MRFTILVSLPFTNLTSFLNLKIELMDKVRSQGTVKIAALRCFLVLEGTVFRCYIFEAVPDVPLVRLWGLIGTKVPIWVVSK